VIVDILGESKKLLVSLLYASYNGNPQLSLLSLYLILDESLILVYGELSADLTKCDWPPEFSMTESKPLVYISESRFF
jgi:hypothetical protein